MKYFIGIALLPNLEIPLHFLWEKTFQQLHIALADNKKADGTSAIGVAFPEYDEAEFSLGTKLRLFAESANDLEQFDCEIWLSRLSDYVSVGEITSVPDHVEGYACFKHVKVKGSKEKLARRRAKRNGESYEEALRHFGDYQQERSRLPFIHMRSETNGQRFRLFIEKQGKSESISEGFSCYGLSDRSTVPMF